MNISSQCDSDLLERTRDQYKFSMAITDDPAELTHADLKELLQDDTSVKVAGCDVDGMLRGKLMSKKKFLSIASTGFGFCSVIFGWDMHDQTYFKELKISNKENGYRDIVAEIDLKTFRRIPWEDNIPFFLCSFREPEGAKLSACPRSLLETAVEKIAKAGYGALAGGKSKHLASGSCSYCACAYDQVKPPCSVAEPCAV